MLIFGQEGGHTKTVPTSQLATAFPRSGAPPHQRPATDVVLHSDPLWQRLQPTYPAIRWPSIAASGGKTGVHRAPRDCTYTVYDHSVACQPLPGTIPSPRSADECCRTVAWRSFMICPHSPLSGTIGFITDLRLPAVIANVDSALRVWALFLQACTTECRGAVGPSCRGGSSR